MFYLLPQQRTETYHRLVVAQVRAETQALHLRSLIPHLRSNELEIVRRGRNAATRRPKRVDPEIYQQATSLETLIGYLYLTDYPAFNRTVAKTSSREIVRNSISRRENQSVCSDQFRRIGKPTPKLYSKLICRINQEKSRLLANQTVGNP